MGIFRKNKMPTISKQKAFMFFTTIADVGSLIIALVYISFVGLMVYLRLGTVWLNWAMFGITVAYIGFFIFKIFYLNKKMTRTGRIKRVVKLANKYTKLGMRGINAAFVVLSLLSVQFGVNQGVALIGVLVVAVTFVVTVLWDIGNFVLRRKIQEYTIAWNSLSKEEKAERIELLMAGFIRSLDNVAGIEEYFDVGINVKKMMDNRMGERIRLADARRVDPYEDIERSREASKNN